MLSILKKAKDTVELTVVASTLAIGVYGTYQLCSDVYGEIIKWAETPSEA